MAEKVNKPVVLILAGPNGAGKSTASRALVHDMGGIDRYVNADAIARGLSPFEPDMSAVAAGRVMIEHIEHLSRDRHNFALETTLSGVRLASRLRALQQVGYRVHLIYLWLPSAELAIQRVSERVRLGGHSIEPDVIRRRYRRSLENLMNIYRPMSQAWRVYDNSGPTLQLVAHGVEGNETKIIDADKWNSVLQSAEEGSGHEE